jgi:hypothetical protein
MVFVVVLSLSSFGIRVIVASLNEYGNDYFTFYFMRYFMKHWCSFIFKYLKDSSVNPSGL